MGAAPARIVARRPRPKAYLLLSRISNLPTVWTNVAAGAAVVHRTEPFSMVVQVAVAISFMYTGGMFLNDAFDARFDAVHRRDRPIPSGDVPRREVLGVGFALLAIAELWLALAVGARALAWGLALAAAIVAYDYRHKQFRFGPLVMGLCRGLVYVVAASLAAETPAVPVALAAAALTCYVMSLTWVAKQTGPAAARVIPAMIAGISLVDAVVILVSGGGLELALGAVCAFALTLALQRVVPGT
jgi:4-hydroxybenzoate polyprenyltransferase